MQRWIWFLLLFIFVAPLYASEGVVALFGLRDFFGPGKGALLVYSEGSGELGLYKVKKERLVLAAKTAAMSRVWQVTLYQKGKERGIVVAYGYGRRNIGASLKVVLYKEDLSDAQVIYEVQSPRSEASFLRQAGAGLMLCYFDSKYYTRLGVLSPTASDVWRFEERFRIRLGMHLDMDGERVLVGRPYADAEEGSGELRLFDGEKWRDLPSVRGISAAVFRRTPKGALDGILIGDGWHQNYGVFAEPRLTWLKFDSARGQYAARLISLTTPQIRIEKIEQVVKEDKEIVLAKGDLFLEAYYPQADWRARRVYEKSSKNPLTHLDFAVLEMEGEDAVMAVFDGDLRLIKVPLTHSAQP